MKLIETLKTSDRTYEDIIAFDNAKEAEDAGFHALCHDETCGGTIYGKPLNPDFLKVCRVAVVLDAGKTNIC